MLVDIFRAIKALIHRPSILMVRRAPFPTRRLLQVLEMRRGFVLQPLPHELRLERCKQCSDILFGSRKTVLECIFHGEVPWVVSAIVVLSNQPANNDIAEENVAIVNARDSPADTNEHGESDAVVA